MSETWPPAKSSDLGRSRDLGKPTPAGKPGHPGQWQPPDYLDHPGWQRHLDQVPYAGPLHEDRPNWQAFTGLILVMLSGTWVWKNAFTINIYTDVGYVVGYRLPALGLACLAVGLCAKGIGRAHSTDRGQVSAIIGATLGGFVIAFALLDICVEVIG